MTNVSHQLLIIQHFLSRVLSVVFELVMSKSKKAVGSLMICCCGAAMFVTQARYPSTDFTDHFSLLCFQPEALRDSIAARTFLLTLECPCGMGTWRGHTINVLSTASRNWILIHQPSSHLGNRHARPHPANPLAK